MVYNYGNLLIFTVNQHYLPILRRIDNTSSKKTFEKLATINAILSELSIFHISIHLDLLSTPGIEHQTGTGIETHQQQARNKATFKMTISIVEGVSE